MSTSATPQPAGRVRLAQRHRAAAGQRVPPPGRAADVRRGGLAGLPAQLDQPGAVRPSRSRNARSTGCPTTGTAAGSVAEVLTTSTSPARSSAGSSVNRWWRTVPAARSPTSRRTPSRVSPRASGGSCASSAGGQREVEQDRHRPAPASRSARRMRPDGGASASSRQEGGHHRVGQRPVADVLAREGLLVHPGAQVARVHPPHPHVRLLRGQHPAGLLERGLRRAVPAPARVRLDRRVGGDVDDRAAAGTQRRQRELDQRRAARRRSPRTPRAARRAGSRRAAAAGSARGCRRC